ncbi:MAG TPA: hypothetical protein VNO30_10595 [Kofleriaceae bacterium]|nr:hypothetical protein [Kofleriaceae bacterium]
MRLIDHAARWGLLLLAAVACGCFGAFEVSCDQDAHCNRVPGGLCHTNPATDRRWCTYPDPACPSGHRYSDLDVGDGVSGTCTGEPPARCDPTADFGEPTLVPNINSSFDEGTIAMTADELTAYISRTDGYSTMLLVSTRRSIAEDFSPPTSDPSLVAVVSSAGIEYAASPTSDGLLLYYHRQLPSQAPRIYVSVRATRDDLFDEGMQVSSGGTAPEAVLGPAPSLDGQTLYWIDYYDFTLRAATRYNYRGFTAQVVVSVMKVSSYALSADELTLYYSWGLPMNDVFVTTRTSKTAPFRTGALVPKVNTADNDSPLFLTADGCQLYLSSTRPGGIGGVDTWIARRPR